MVIIIFHMTEQEAVPIVLGAKEGENESLIFWTQIAFIFAGFIEGMIGGLIPTWSTSCRKSPKILGIGNAFACGVFLAIGLCHMTPENAEGWEKIVREHHPDKKKIFPMAEVLMLFGYTVLLLVDKVMFDAHAFFDPDHQEHGHQDPVTKKLSEDVQKSMSPDNRGQVQAIGDSVVTDDAAKSFLSCTDNYAARMKAGV